MTNRTRLFAVLATLVASPAAFAQTPDPAPTPAPAPAAAPAPAPAPTPAPAPEPAAPPAPPETPVVIAPAPVPAPAAETKPSVLSKFDTTLYGFVEFDAIHDSTQGLNDLPGNANLARPGTYGGDNGQTLFGARNSRIGLKLAAPTYNDIKVTGQLEMDFMGNQPPNVSEAGFWQNPGFRFRHMNLKMETPVVDILIGQYWQLFGWQSLYHPNTVEIQGIPGQVYSRAPQLRISKKIKSGDLTFEVAVAAARPPQKASSTPDGHAGFKVSYDKLKAWHTSGSTGSGLDSLSLGVSVVGRRFSVAELSATPMTSVTRNGYGLSVDALVPLIPATKESKANALTFTGSYVTGAGIADLYTGLSGGVSNPAPPNPTMATPAPVYTPNVDNGLVMFASDGTLHPVQWNSFIVGLQYYLPPSGKLFVSANYSHMKSPNDDNFGDHKKVFDTSDWADANLMYDVTPAVRLGAEFAWFNQHYLDGVDATNYRGQFSAFLLF